MRKALRIIGIAVAALVILAPVAALVTWRNARADPVVRRAVIALPRWPAGAAPIRVALVSDVHLASAAMDEGRLTRIVERIAALRPDLLLVAGDFIEGDVPADAAGIAVPLARALSRIRPRLGIVAVPGNHDHWTSVAAMTQAVERAGGMVLANRAIVRGPLAIGGVDDEYTGHDDLPGTLAALRPLSGARVLLTHSPDLAPLVPADVTLVLAGHSHCGQVVLPLVGPPVLPLRTRRRYMCGIVREGARTTIVTAGLGTSELPFRLAAPPDLWLLTLGPQRTARR